MLISIRRFATTITSRSQFPPRRPQSCRVPPVLPLSADQDPKLALEALKRYGFTNTHICKLVQRAPWIATSKPESTLMSKMSYFCKDLCLGPSQLVKIVTSDPQILRSSLENTIIPSVDFLTTVLGDRSIAVRAILREPWLLRPAHSNVAANVAVLKGMGAPDSSISRLLLARPRMLMHNPAPFRELVDVVMSAGFSIKTQMFVYAMIARSGVSNSNWEKKADVYVSCGWSREETHLAFRKCPILYMYSEEKIKRQLEFTMRVVKLRAIDLLMYTKLLTCSLEKTMIPRCCVLDVLIRRGLLKKGFSLPTALSRTREIFEERFVNKYQEEIPDILEAYHGKMSFVGFDHMS